MLKTERRKTSPDHETKRLIVSTIAVVAVMLAFAVIVLSLNGTAVPDPLDRLANIVLGALIGFLAKTSVDALDSEPVPVTNAPGDALETTVRDSAAGMKDEG